ncbi:MAG: GDSL-like Lipase/Acylhydrolase [Aeromicrobium sp.]|jgi:hypothetical protein|nr:GDSL-like Lipase/Acylhydrolase [Aeromicrobium sp.]
MTRRRRVAATWATALVLAGCGAPDGSAGSYGAPTTAPAAGISSYVALGDSYVSGPGIDEPVATAGYCLRSTRNYPALLAADLAIDDVTDVSCGGATTAGVLAPSTVQQLPVPAQLDAVAPDSDLVTIGIGAVTTGSRRASSCRV